MTETVYNTQEDNDDGLDWSEYDIRATQPRARLQVRMSPAVREELDPLFKPRTRAGYKPILELAERITATEALGLLAVEPPTIKGKYAAVSFTPTTKLLDRAASLHLSPHVLVRAAAVKLARRMRRERLARERILRDATEKE